MTKIRAEHSMTANNKKISRKRFQESYKKLLKEHPRLAKLSAKQLAKRAGISPQYTYGILSPTAKRPLTTHQICRLCRGLGLTKSKCQKWIKTMTSGKSVKHSQFAIPNKEKFLEQQAKKPIVMYYPINRGLPLARFLEQQMSSKQMNQKAIARQCGINKERLHEFFQGKEPVLPRLTIFRLSMGLHADPHTLLKLNHQEIAIGAKILSQSKERHRKLGGYHENAQTPHEDSDQLNRTSVVRLIRNVEHLNDADVDILNLLANRMLDANPR